MKNHKLKIIRKKIDFIDHKLLYLIGKRTNLVKKIIKIKRQKKQIVDHQRIKQVLKNIKKKSIKNKIDTILTYKIWNALIRSYIDFELRNFKKKK